jgi:acetyl-CoA carboxylase biotin carboxyl carrier protein
MADKKRKLHSTEETHVNATPGTSFDLEALKQIVELLEASEVTSLDWRRNGERLSIRRGPPPAHVMQPMSMPVSSGVQVLQSPPASNASASLPNRPSAPVALRPTVASDVREDKGREEKREEKKGLVITSPFVGTFYRSPAPDQPAYVEVGASVKKGQTLCIIEAMKLMNEIEADVTGKVTEVLAQNGQPVEFGQPLFRIEP